MSEPSRARPGPVGLGLAAAGAVGLVAAGAARAAAAVTNPDIRSLQTAAALENLAVAAYAALATRLDANPTLAAFATTTVAQHRAHAGAFNAAAAHLGGARQDGVPPGYYATAQQALPAASAEAAVSLALDLESTAAQTYTRFVSEVATAALRSLFLRVAPVEAQHAAVLQTALHLLRAGHAGLLAAPPDLARLPAAAGTAGLPASFEPTTRAAASTAGAVL